MRLIKDVILFTTKEIPKWNPINVCSYHLQEAGATPVQELAFALATAIAVLDTVKASDEVSPDKFGDVVGRISFFVNAGLRFITELCKMRAFTELWDEITRERYGITDAKQRLFRYGVQVNSLGLTEPQPENNVARILIEMLAVTLSKNARARAVQLPDGTRRTDYQERGPAMVIVHATDPDTTDLLDYGDIFDGSGEIARKVDDLKHQAVKSSKRIEEMGSGRRRRHRLPEQQLVESNTVRLEAIERGEQIVVGVNKYLESEPSRWQVPRTLSLLCRMTPSETSLIGLRLGAIARQGGGSRGLERVEERRARRRQHYAGFDCLRQSRSHDR
jgi:(2R)-ethylmalonyl-CoA mutase